MKKNRLSVQHPLAISNNITEIGNLLIVVKSHGPTGILDIKSQYDGENCMKTDIGKQKMYN